MPREVEQKALELVRRFEQKNGRKARPGLAGCGYDLKSGDRSLPIYALEEGNYVVIEQ